MAEEKGLTFVSGDLVIEGLLKESADVSKQKDGSLIEHIFIQPAPDEYSHPKTYAVLSDKILGPVGTVFPVHIVASSSRNKGFFNVRLWAA